MVARLEVGEFLEDLVEVCGICGDFHGKEGLRVG